MYRIYEYNLRSPRRPWTLRIWGGGGRGAESIEWSKEGQAFSRSYNLAPRPSPPPTKSPADIPSTSHISMLAQTHTQNQLLISWGFLFGLRLLYKSRVNEAILLEPLDGWHDNPSLNDVSLIVFFSDFRPLYIYHFRHTVLVKDPSSMGHIIQGTSHLGDGVHRWRKFQKEKIRDTSVFDGSSWQAFTSNVTDPLGQAIIHYLRIMWSFSFFRNFL